MDKRNTLRLIVGIIFTFIICYQIYEVVISCDGKYIYPLDDTYIHLAMADNMSSHGVWGITQYEFSSSSSSLLYTLILSGLMLVFGNNDFIPLIVNFISSYFLIIVIFNLLKKYIVRHNSENHTNELFSKANIVLTLATMFIVFSAPMIILTLSGMEHSLQILINLLFVIKLIEYLDTSSAKGIKNLIVLSIFVSSIRYEGIFLILIAAIFLAVRKQYREALWLILFSSIPIVIYGLISFSNGWMFLPNSILLKSSKPSDFTFLSLLLYPFAWVIKLLAEPHLFTIFISSLSLLYVNYKQRRSLLGNKNLWLLITIMLTILHLTFAKTGWVYRYESYIVVIGLVALIINISELIKFGDIKLKNAAIAILLVLLLACGMRSYNSIIESNTMSQNIYQQQYQMSQFLAEFYNKSSVVLGDIGAATYFTDIKLLDLVSLGNIEPLKLKLDKKFNAEEIEKLAIQKNCKIAILYKDAFKDFIPDSWIETGSWKISNNIGCYMDKVTFYAISGDDFLPLSENLIKFKKRMPVDIEVIIPLEPIINSNP